PHDVVRAPPTGVHTLKPRPFALFVTRRLRIRIQSQRDRMDQTPRAPATQRGHERISFSRAEHVAIGENRFRAAAMTSSFDCLQKPSAMVLFKPSRSTVSLQRR